MSDSIIDCIDYVTGIGNAHAHNESEMTATFDLALEVKGQFPT